MAGNAGNGERGENRRTGEGPTRAHSRAHDAHMRYGVRLGAINSRSGMADCQVIRL
jgi:hypothetical protein